MQINASLSALGNLLALIQESNSKFASYTEDQLSVVSIAAQTADAQGRNAVATVALDGFADTAPFQFTRLGLTDNVVNPSLTLSVDPTTMSASDVHAAIAGALALVTDEVQISSDAFAADGSLTAPATGQNATVTVQANPSSLLYVESAQVAITLVFPPPVVVTPPTPSITSLVDNAALNGFTAAQAAPVAPSAPAADGQAPAATDGTTPAAPAADGTTAAPAADGTTPAAPAADGQAAAPVAADGQTAAATDGTTAPAATDGQAPAPVAADGQAAPAAAADGTTAPAAQA